VKLFVYGTLMRGHSPHTRLMKGAILIGHGSIQGKRISLSTFVPSNAWAVDGELYEVPEANLRGLDSYEGHPYLWKRRITPVKIDDMLVDAWVYHPPAE
jgi:gamma-glutamylcyclotransferase (GGCT)/AIG2-like uncharacterized protein YtfP